MANIDTSGLSRFREQLESLKNIGKFTEKIVEQTANRGKNILESKYTQINSGNETPSVNTTISGNKAQIVASGEDVMFEEFGTGSVGRDSNYQGNLPSSGVPITSSWQYNYDSPYKLYSASGKVKGWIHDGEFTRGIPSGHQIFDTARQLEKEIPSIVRNVLEKGTRND